jgi:hypothetical protein
MAKRKEVEEDVERVRLAKDIYWKDEAGNVKLAFPAGNYRRRRGTLTTSDDKKLFLIIRGERIAKTEVYDHPFQVTMLVKEIEWDENLEVVMLHWPKHETYPTFGRDPDELRDFETANGQHFRSEHVLTILEFDNRLHSKLRSELRSDVPEASYHMAKCDTEGCNSKDFCSLTRVPFCSMGICMNCFGLTLGSKK